MGEEDTDLVAQADTVLVADIAAADTVPVAAVASANLVAVDSGPVPADRR
jgi:hypothetical protein